jgi:TolB-like protein
MVLPFENPTGDPDVDIICSSLSEDVVVGLSRISTIRVAARNVPGRRGATDTALIARDLGMRYVLEGSVRKQPNALRVTVQLIDAANGHHIWAQQINRIDADHVFDLHDEVSGSIVASVQTQIILSEGRDRPMDAGSERVSRLLARSWRRLLGLTEESLAECRALAERVLELEGRNGAAHRMRAVALYHQLYMGFIPWTQDTINAIYAHAKRAIEGDEADEYSHWAMECAHLLRGEHELAAESLRRALEINPNCSLAIGSMGTVLAWSGRYDASVEANELALRTNPQDPSNFYRHFGLALAHYLAGRYDKSVAHARMVVQARPGWWLAKIVYAAGLAQSERPSEAARTLADVRPGGDAFDISVLKVLPFASANDREHLTEGLRKSGVGE